MHSIYKKGVVIAEPPVGAFPPEVAEWLSDNFAALQTATRCIATMDDGAVTVQNTVVETPVYHVDVWPNQLHSGDSLTLDLTGFYRAALAADTFTVRIQLNGISILTFVHTGAQASSVLLLIKASITILYDGVNGAAMFVGYMTDNGAIVTDSSGTSVAGIDTTLPNQIAVTVTWGAAKALNELSITHLLVTANSARIG